MNFKRIILTISLISVFVVLYNANIYNNEVKLLKVKDGFCVCVSYENETQIIYPWYDETTGIWELFLPAYLNNGENIKVINEAEEFCFVNFQTDNNRVILKNKTIYEILGTGQETYKIRFNLSENISSLFIETESGTMQNVNKDKNYEESGQISSVNQNGIIEYLGDLECISGHGNGTWFQEKKPYDLKLTQYGTLAGLTPTKDWVLLAMYYEGDKIHSKVAYDLEKLLGGKYPSECAWVDVYLNGKYNGLYLLINSIKGRFQFEKDGFLIEKEMEFRLEDENFLTYSGETFEVKKSTTSKENVVNQIQKCEDDIYKGVLNYDVIDIESFVIQFMVDMISLNFDSFKTSSYIYKLDKYDKIYAGPSWDYDGAFAEYLHQGKNWVDPEGEIFFNNLQLDWYYLLYNIPEFQSLVAEKFAMHCEEIEYVVNVKISEYAECIKTAVENENIRWKFTKGTLHRAGTYRTWENNVRYLQYFLNKRLQYLSDLWEIPRTEFEWISMDEIHEVKLVMDDVTKVIEILDGETLCNLPETDRKWFFQYSGEEYVRTLPILEDCTLILE